MNIFDTLKKLRFEEEVRTHPPMRISKDETGRFIYEPLVLDSAASALIHTVKQANQAKEIHKSIFGN